MNIRRSTQERERPRRRTHAAHGIDKIVLSGLIHLLAVASVMAGKPTAPAAPTGLTATAVSSSQINLTWADNASDETAYYVERSIGSSASYSVIATLPANATSYSNSGLSTTTTYNYRVRAYNASANNSVQYSSYSNIANATTPATYIISTTPSPSAGGTTSGGGTMTAGTTATVIAAPNSGYNFANWTENGAQVSTSASYSFTVSANRNLIANFSAVTTYTISTSPSPAAGGTTSGGGIKASGTVATVSASANSGYNFVNWTENGAQVSTSATYNFTVTGNRTLVANFSVATVNYTISTSPSPAAGGTTTGGGIKASGTVATVSASANSGYNFVNWTENGAQVSTSATYNFTVTGNRTLVANFSAVTTSYTIATSSSPTAGGTTSGGGAKASGSVATVTAAANSGYTFASWRENGAVASTSATYSFTVTGDRTLVANFTTDTVYYTITTSSSPPSKGTTTGGGAVASGTLATVSAYANSGYHFVNWTENGTQVSTSANYSFTVNGIRSLVANFSSGSVNYTITTSSSPPAGGTTSGGGSVADGTMATVTATASSGYTFVNWTENGTQVSTSATYSFTVNGNRTLVANFGSLPTYTISTSSLPSVGGTTGGGGSYISGSTVTVTATPNSCYNFVSWTEGGVLVSTSANYSFTASGNRTLVANFSQLSYTITTSSAPTVGGSASGGGSKVCGTGVTVTATASSGYLFSNWTEGGTVVSISANYTFTASASRTLVANFVVDPAITTSSSPTAGGSTSGGGMYLPGATVTVLATPNGGYAFANWTEGGTVVSTSASYTFTASVNRTLVANFTTSTSYTITTSSSPAAGGTTSGGGIKTSGSMVTIVATANSGYSFASWTENGVVQSTSSSYSFTAIGDRNLIANFTVASTSSWVTSIGGTGVDVGYSTATDASGNIIVAGYFSGTVNFGGGALTSAGAQDIFVAKYSPSGAHLWSTRFGGSADDEAQAVAVDKRNGDVFVTGYFNATATFGNTTYTSTNLKNIFLVKLSSSSGAVQWSKAIGGSSALGNSAAYSLAVDPNNGDVALAGVVAGNVDFGAGVTYVSVDSAPFVARYSTTGDYVFARSYYAGMVGNAGRVAVDGGGNVYFGVHAQQSVNFGNGALPHPVGTGNDIYLAKFTALGTLTWSAAYTTTNCELYALAVDPNNNLAMAGRFIGPWNLGGGIVLNSTPTSSAQQSAFVARLSALNGAVSSAAAFACTNIAGGSANSAANGLAFDSQGNYTIAGYFQGSGLAGGTRLSAPTISDLEAFAIKYSSANAVVWAKRFGGTGSDSGNSVATDGSANVVITGSTFGGDFSGVTLTSAGGADIFVLKLAP